MAEPKTRPTNVRPAKFLATIPDETKRRDAEWLMEMMTRVTGKPPILNRLADVDRDVLTSLAKGSVDDMMARTRGLTEPVRPHTLKRSISRTRIAKQRATSGAAPGARSSTTRRRRAAGTNSSSR